MALIIAKIGDFSFIVLNGTVNPGTGETVVNISRPNTDGQGYRLEGKRGQPFVVNTVVDVEDVDAGKLLVYDYKELVGTLVTMRDAQGKDWPNIMVLGVRPGRENAVKVAVGGIGDPVGALVRAEWTLQSTESIETA